MKIAIIGTGYIAQRFVKLIRLYKDAELACVLTRRPVEQVWDIFPKVTKDPHLLNDADVVVDFSGDAKFLNFIIENFYNFGKLVTFNSEFHVTYSNVAKRYPELKITEGEGDQPGSFAVLARRIKQLGMEPMMFVNNKRYLDYNPDPDSMKKWASNYGLSEKITVASTDGTKVSFETAFIANAFGLDIPVDPKRSYYRQMLDLYPPFDKLAFVALTSNKGISILAKTTKSTKIKDLQYLGVPINEKTWTEFSIPYHLCQYDIINTIRDLYYRDDILLNGSMGHKKFDVYTISKTWLNPGDIIKTGIGGYDVRGEIREVNKDYLPVIDCENVRIKSEISPGDIITTDMVEKLEG